MARDTAATPVVSVIVPCYNERTTIRLLLDGLCAQTYPMEKMEFLLADGRSTDGTRDEIGVYQQEHPEMSIRVIDNPDRAIPAALNRALAAARGEFVVRLDAHAMPYPDYVERCVAALQAGAGDNVGGVWEIRAGGKGWVAESIARAAAHPLGVGDALYRFTTKAAEVDTVPFGAFHLSTFERVGRFDETLLTNEDYEFNARVRAAGGKVWLDPAIRSIYFARASLSALARQYFRYGYWKLRMLKRYPKTLKPRQALPPVFVLGLLVLLLAAPWLTVARWLLVGVVCAYTAVLGVGTARAARSAGGGWRYAGIPIAIATMHACWGAGFLWSLIGFKL